MAELVYIISTMSNDNIYCIYEKRNDIKVVSKEIRIYGGANIQNPRTLQMSSNGVTTAISKDDFEDLKNVPMFQEHLEKGFISIIQSNENDAKKKSEKVNLKDKSAQYTEENYTKEKGFRIAPTTKLDKIKVG